MASVDELERRFGAPGKVRIDEGRGGFPRVRVTGELADAEIYLHGAHLTAFQPRGAQPLLFMSEESLFEANKPIRGGVPVIFPWFGPKAQAPDAPMHGFARTRSWDLESCDVHTDGTVSVSLQLKSDDATRRLWPHEFGLRMIYTLGASLGMELEVRAAGEPLVFEEALHTYFRVGDVRQAGVEGLANTEYLDKVDAFRRKTQDAEPIRIAGETDRIYLNTRAACLIHDPVLQRTITVEKEGSDTTVVWNPWIAKSRAMADFGDDEWPGMLCIETANVGDASVRLGAGQTHRMRAHLRVSPRA